MDLFGINGYCLEKRAKLVLKHGAHITTRQSGQYTISLYHMGHFFAEIWFRQFTNKIMLVRGFDDEVYLETYLNTIDVSELIS